MIKPGQELVVDKKQPANHADANKAQALPETGEENPFIGTTVFGGLSFSVRCSVISWTSSRTIKTNNTQR